MAAPDERLRRYLERVAAGPRLGKHLSAAEAYDAIDAILSDDADPVRAGALLIALRVQGETLDELRGALAAVRARARWAAARVAALVDLADPYDGFLRHLPASPFLPAVLAACGLPAVCHGPRSLPPKRGATIRQVLEAAGAVVDASPGDAAARIADPDIGWAFVDLDRSHPELAALAPVRDAIVKRPLLAVVDKLHGPVRADRTIAVAGFVHRDYGERLVQLAADAGYAAAIAVRGVEGGVIPPLNAGTVGVGWRAPGDPPAPVAVAATDVGITGADRAPPLPAGCEGAAAIAREAARAGRAALAGALGPTRDALVYAAASILWFAGRAASPADAAARARAVLDDGSAARRFAA
ncbi:MAG: anthranilate phosphoribosyltransferase [Deltaproteobacteria bacterium]|nr:MAG: anthranilate phosphoribosyltransferase [Deltaproteobacteria bacterium]